MPYISQKDRPRLDSAVETVANEIKSIAATYGYPGAFAGLLNYSMTRLIQKVIPERRYWTIALISGVIHNVLDEFYRRYGVPYEEEQIDKNGDVY